MGIDPVAELALGKSLTVGDPGCSLDVVGDAGEEDVDHREQGGPLGHGGEDLRDRDLAAAGLSELLQAGPGRALLENRTHAGEDAEVLLLPEWVHDLLHDLLLHGGQLLGVLGGGHHDGKALEGDLLSGASQLLVPHHGRDGCPVGLPPVGGQLELSADLGTHLVPDDVLEEGGDLLRVLHVAGVHGHGLGLGAGETRHHQHHLLIDGRVDDAWTHIAGPFPREGLGIQIGAMLPAVGGLAVPEIQPGVVGLFAPVVVPEGVPRRLDQLGGEDRQIVGEVPTGIEGADAFNL